LFISFALSSIKFGWRVSRQLSLGKKLSFAAYSMSSDVEARVIVRDLIFFSRIAAFIEFGQTSQLARIQTPPGIDLGPWRCWNTGRLELTGPVGQSIGKDRQFVD
jgi:hypothetical protein